MSNFGGTDAESLKTGIDSIFAQDGLLPLDETTDYTKKFVGATADGASVNFGHISGLLTRLEVSRPWLLKIHCSNHRTELSVGDVFDNKSPFSGVDETYKGIFYLHRNSGKILNEVKEACASLDITYYKLRKIHGTRFISHRRRGFKCLLDIYPALINAYEKVVANNSTKYDVRAKVGGYLKKLKSFRFFMLLVRYTDITNSMSPLSLTFEKGVILPSDIVQAIKRSEFSLREFDCDDSFYEVNEDGEMSAKFLKAGHSRKKKQNREHVVIPFDFMTHDGDILRIVNAHAHDANEHIINRLRERFSDFFDNQSLYQSMDFIDPENWVDEDSNYGREAIQHIVDHFEIPLLHAKFENKFVLKEWKKLHELVKKKYSKFVNNVPLLWKKIFVFRRSEFPNVCLLAELIFSISSSNSAVERCFNILTQILSNTRLSMKHDTVNMLMIIKCNNMIWSEEAI